LLLRRDLRSLEHAAQEFKRALALRRNARTLGGVGSAYLSVRQFEAAAKYFELAIAQDPSKYIYHLGLGLSLQKLDANNAEATREFHQALDRIANVLSTGPEKPLVLAHKGVCHAALGEREKARLELDRARDTASQDQLVLGVVREGYQLLGNTK
jgi:tetratricopeptide (TPR) repeat protein